MDTFEVPDCISAVSVFRHVDESRYAGFMGRLALLQKSDSIPNALPPDRLGDGQKRLHLPI